MVIVPSVDVRGGRVVFRGGVAAEVAPADLALRFVAQGADELHLVDLDAAETGAPVNRPVLEAIARSSSTSGVPCRLAGGVSTLGDARTAIAAGFAGVLFSSAVFGDDTLLAAIAALGQRAIVEIEARDGLLAPRGGDLTLVRRAAGRDAVDAAIAAVDAGVGALYVIDVSADGKLGGPPLALLSRVRDALGARATRVEFHTGGGVRDLADVRALARWGAASVVVGRAIADGRFTVAQAKEAAEE